MKNTFLALISLCSPTLAGDPPNILLILMDDVGRDRVAAYGDHPNPGNTPVIDSLAANGLLFRNAWSNPFCSPTRAALLSGKHAFRTGIGSNVKASTPFDGLDTSTVTLADSLVGYATRATGKWQISSDLVWPCAPLQFGFDSYGAGIRFGITRPFTQATYVRWARTDDCFTTPFLGYATTAHIDDVINWAPDEPWFSYLALFAAHYPWHVPPADLHTFDLQGNPGDDIPLHHRAAVEALDTEVGRLLASIDVSNTIVVILGDNGTPKLAVDAPGVPTQAKGSLYEGGIRVPMIICGPGIPSGVETDALVQVLDLYATLVELSGNPVPPGLDSLTFAHLFGDPSLDHRGMLYSERFQLAQAPPYGAHRRAARDEKHKLQDIVGSESFFDLEADPLETTDLLPLGLNAEQQAAYDALSAFLDNP